MTPDKRRLAIWTGIGAVVVATGFAVIFVRGASHAETLSQADELHAAYLKHYHPDKPNGFAIEQARDELRTVAKSQAEELATAEGALAPPLPAPYLVDSLSEAAAQVTSDYSALRQLSARTKVGIPASLPFEGGLDADGKARARQLASLALVRLAVQTCIHARVGRVASVNPGQGFASSGGEYAVFTVDLEVEGDWPATARLVAALAQADGSGVGLRALEVTGGPDKPLRTRLTAALTTSNREAWGLAAVPATASAPASGGAGAAPAGGEGRLRRLGGARP